MDDLIKRHPFFAGMSPRQQRLLADCALPRLYNRGELILDEADPDAGFYVILQGGVALQAHLSGGGRFPVQSLGPGNALGWSWLYPPYFRNFTACATERTVVLSFDGKALREKCEADHDFGYSLVKRLGGIIANRIETTDPKGSLNVEPASNAPSGIASN